MAAPASRHPDPRATCWTLVRSAADGDLRARSSFSRSYARVIRGFLESRWRGRRLMTEVDDATQDVFMECLKRDGVLVRATEGDGSFRALLYAVTRNVACRYEERALARRQLLPPDTQWVAGLAADDPGQETIFQRTWASVLVKEAGELYRERAEDLGPDAGRRCELLERRFNRGEAIRDIASEWGVPAQDVHNAYRKARQEFYGCLREVVAFHAPSAADVDAECRSLLESLG